MASTQWHCYYWRGRIHDYNDAQRRDLQVAIPPIQVKYWLQKPASMRVAIHADMDTALEWLMAEYDKHRPSMMLEEPKKMEHRPNAEHLRRCLAGEKIVLCGYWMQDITQAQMVIVPNESVDLRLP
ncbi:MAG: hypothetical protein HOQ05_00555 [Corynebacteriales bacterium]|nr:hypothetical protein [Mycobacteriales bacterium]